MNISHNLRKEDILNYLNSRKEDYHNRYHVRKIALIGSFARNEQNEKSDIDILVDIEEGTLYLRSEAFLEKLAGKKFGRKVEIASERYLKPYYRAQILQEAVYV